MEKKNGKDESCISVHRRFVVSFRSLISAISLPRTTTATSVGDGEGHRTRSSEERTARRKRPPGPLRLLHLLLGQFPEEPSFDGARRRRWDFSGRCLAPEISPRSPDSMRCSTLQNGVVKAEFQNMRLFIGMVCSKWCRVVCEVCCMQQRN